MSPDTTERVLVTGASGFIGRHCIEPLLAGGYEVHAASSSVTPGERDGVGWHRTDLLRQDEISRLIGRVRPDRLLHLAWYVVPGSLLSSHENIRWVQASLELLRQFREHGGVRAVLAGSGYEYSWTWDEGRCSEAETPLDPTTLYGVSKNALRQLADAYADASGLSVAWARLFFLYGPGEHPDRLVASVIRSLLQGQPARCSHGRQLRDCLYVDDVAEALVALVASPTQGAINIGAGEPTALKDIVMAIGALVGRPDLIRLGALPARENDVARVVADTRRLRSELTWRPRFDLDTGLRRTIEWWRARMETTETNQS